VSLKTFSRRQWIVLVILMLINFVNYVDRQIIFSLFPAIRHQFSLNYAQLGALATAFTIVLSVSSLPLGVLADRFSRRLVISGGVLFWSAATFLSGLANSFRMLLVARGLVGVGEAAYTPAGTAIISATFPRQIRARVQGFFDMGMFFGGAVGIALGGIVAEWLGWRAAFFMVGVPGLILGLSGLRLPEATSHSRGGRLPVREIIRVPAYLVMLAAASFSSFAGYAYVAWGPDFVQEYKHFTSSESGITLGVTVLLAGGFGILTGATLADWFAKLRPWGRAGTVPIGFFLAAPAIYFALHSSSKPQFAVWFGIGTFFLSWYHGPTTATIHDIIPARGHATAIGLYYTFINLFAMAMAPLVIGAIADRYGLLWALHGALVSQLIGGGLFAAVPYCIHRDGVHHEALAPHWARELDLQSAE
jgi:MFS transporter, Spinster family, sphingosine-1-phosphate transporter